MSSSESLEKSEIFANNFYEQLELLKPDQNAIFSPLSIRITIAMVRMGADNETGKELDKGMGFCSCNLTNLVKCFGQLLTEYENSGVLKIANKLYVMEGVILKKEFNDVLTHTFLLSPENINFALNIEAAVSINSWVETVTNNCIKDLIQPDDLDDTTQLVLINAIYFKGMWEIKFNEASTKEDDFYLNDVQKIQMPMMNVEGKFRYAELPNLNSTVLEMRYKDTDLSMLVILPNTKTGLKRMQQDIKKLRLKDITDKLNTTKVIVKFPKFKSEMDVELSGVFEKLGMARMFSNDAEFGNITEEKVPLKVSKIIHKAFIDVNEEGTEAAAATGTIMMFRSVPAPQQAPKLFIANRPFYYTIYNNKNGSFFMGKFCGDK